MELSGKKKEARAKLEIVHRMGKRSYAVMNEIMEKMKEMAAQNNENLSDPDAMRDTDDIFARIMTKDKNGRLCMYGLGVKPSDIYGGRPSHDALYRKIMEAKEEIRVLKQKVEELTTLMQNKSHSNTQFEAQRAMVSPTRNQNLSESSSRLTRIRVGAYVKLKKSY